jgi:hypothetical protein
MIYIAPLCNESAKGLSAFHGQMFDQSILEFFLQLPWRYLVRSICARLSPINE